MESNRFAAPSRRERRLRVANVVVANVVVECRRMDGRMDGRSVGRTVGWPNRETGQKYRLARNRIFQFRL